tara:strand:- start:255 stop:491 length:237 start_codon:yes stop_codon:yes gene_type:complete
MDGFATKIENPTEQDMLEMAEDFKQRINKKNQKISQLTKLIFVIYGLTRRGLEVEDSALFEEVRSVCSEFLLEEYELE